MALAFVGLGLAMLAGRATASALSNRTGQTIIRELRLMLAQRILAASLDALERYRTHRLLPVLTGDVGMVSGLSLSLPMTVVAASVVLGCVLWLAWLSVATRPAGARCAGPIAGAAALGAGPRPAAIRGRAR